MSRRVDLLTYYYTGHGMDGIITYVLLHLIGLSRRSRGRGPDDESSRHSPAAGFRTPSVNHGQCFCIGY
jgi:hypothetical protein